MHVCTTVCACTVCACTVCVCACTVCVSCVGMLDESSNAQHNHNARHMHTTDLNSSQLLQPIIAIGKSNVFLVYMEQ